jgi:hypothetical protein
MTNDEIRIAVAELRGWRNVERLKDTNGRWAIVGMTGNRNYRIPVPNYPESLDACSEFEQTLGGHKQISYGRELLQLLGFVTPPSGFYEYVTIAMATPLQRCQAFLRLHGKWKEDKQ